MHEELGAFHPGLNIYIPTRSPWIIAKDDAKRSPQKNTSVPVYDISLYLRFLKLRIMNHPRSPDSQFLRNQDLPSEVADSEQNNVPREFSGAIPESQATI